MEGITCYSRAILHLFKARILDCYGDEGDFTVKLVDRDGFLLSFKHRARGKGIAYIDYSDCPLAITASYMDWQNRQKKRTRSYSERNFDVCHGFISENTGNKWLQV